MTQPAPDSRHTVDSLTSDALDQLYMRLATAEREADEAVAAAAHLARLVGKRSEKAERNAKKQHLRADLAEIELRTLRTGLRANGADPTQIQNLWAQIHLRNRQWREEKQRAERAEAALAAGIPLVCTDERHQAKVAALDAALNAARAVEQEWREYFIARGDAPAGHALAMVRAALDAHTNPTAG
jgi:hypothetical protein